MPVKNPGVNSIENAQNAPKRGPKPTLAADRIARFAIGVADAEGLAAVTMQRIGREMGVSTMALYRYFPAKADLLALMIDSAGPPDRAFGKPSQSWSERLKTWARRCLSIYRDHPWVLEATSTRRSVMGPNELSWMEAALAMLAESGLAPGDRHAAFLALIAHVRGHATFQGDSSESARALDDLLHSQPDRYPALSASIWGGHFPVSSARAFDFGLDCILEGIHALVAR